MYHKFACNDSKLLQGQRKNTTNKLLINKSIFNFSMTIITKVTHLHMLIRKVDQN